MFRIQLHQFRCWENLSLEFPIGNIVLIKGNSGSGKTTILQGITWCLYGNIRLVAPNHLDGKTGPKAKTHVIIELPFNLNGNDGILTINRQKNPGRLIVSHSPIDENRNPMPNTTITYEDKVAQSLINDIFGVHDIWLASCYIGQGSRNIFLTAPNTGKMELLNNIAFHEEDPAIYIEKIDALLSELDTNYKVKSSSFTNNLTKLQQILSATDIQKALTPEQISDINSQITSLLEKESALKRIKEQRDINIGMINAFTVQLQQNKKIIVTVPSPDKELIALNSKYNQIETNDSIRSLNSIEYMESNIQTLMSIISTLQQRDVLNSEIRKYDSLLLPYVNIKKDVTYTKEDYHDAISKEMSLRDNQKLALNLGVLYSEQAIKETIRQYQNLLSSQDRLKLENECMLMASQINDLQLQLTHQNTPIQFPDLSPCDIPIPDYSKYSTESLSTQVTELFKKQGSIQAHIQHLQKGMDVLQCPQCTTSLRYQNGKLNLADMAPANINELTKSQQELSLVNVEINKLNKEIQSLTSAGISERSSYEYSVDMERKRIDALKERTKQLELEKQRRDISKQTIAQQLNDLNEKYQQKLQMVAAMPEISTHNRKILSISEIENTHSTIGKLGSIMMVQSPPVSSQQIQSNLTYQDISQKNAEAILAYTTFIENVPVIFHNESIINIQNYIDKLRSHITKIRDSIERQIQTNKLVESLENQIKELSNSLPDDPTNEIININTEINKYRELLQLSVKAHEAIKYHSQVSQEREELIKANEELSDIQTFREHAVRTECKILEEVVDSINESIQGVCSTLFDRDINIVLNLFKTLKTTKNVKPLVNFNISYQGGNFDNINQMSGGEGDRASLALTLALNRLSSCPILMLDESLASLDLNMKEAAIQTIRENTNNTVLVIMHDGVDGIYDVTINIDEIAQGRY